MILLSNLKNIIHIMNFYAIYPLNYVQIAKLIAYIILDKKKLFLINELIKIVYFDNNQAY